MLSRAMTPRRTKKNDRYDEDSCRSMSVHEYEEFIVGFREDLPLNFCDYHSDAKGKRSRCEMVTLKEALRASVGVLGESPLGMSEKVVLLGGKTCAIKRFRMVVVKRVEFEKRVEKIAQVSSQCEFLVPLSAYLYAKRIKLVVCDYYPMGSLADLLSGARERDQTALEWAHRLHIVLNIAEALAFIHSQTPRKDKEMYLNLHGNVKASNIMVNVDFTARLSDYGFSQLACRIEYSEPPECESPPPVISRSNFKYCERLSQKSDVYNFGIVLLDVLGIKKGDVIRRGENNCFEFEVRGKEKKQAWDVLHIALDCMNVLPEERPSMDKVLVFLRDVKKGI